MPTHKVRQGECIHSIAAQHGFFWEKLWNDPGNADLKQQRSDPSVLKPGDVVHIPAKEPKVENGSSEQRHRFKRKGIPNRVRIQIMRNDEPQAGKPYRLQIDGKLETGTTDAQGMVEMIIPPEAKRGELHVGEGNDVEIYHFQLGTVDPVDTENGARGRLRCLGYDDSLPFDELLKEFQQKEALTASGQLDDATQATLKEKFGE